MELAEFERLAERFAGFWRRYAPLFGRWATRDRGEQYLHGLLVGGAERRNAENLAEQIEGATAGTLQRFLTRSPWSTAPVVTRLQEDTAALLEAPDAVFVVDETGFAKQGTKSVGVARQYSGTLGKVGNCQVGVFLGYASDRGHALIDARLYLPEVWTDDRARCDAAGVPAEVGFATKPAVALAMLRQARRDGQLQARWVIGDAVYGGNPELRDALAADGLWSVLDVPTPTPVCPVRGAAPGAWSGHSRRRPDLGRPTTVGALAEALPPEQWHQLPIAEGAQGPRVDQFAQQRVREVRDGVVGREATALFRRNPDGSELKHYLATTPPGLDLITLGQVASRRWTIELGFEQAKGETGLDEYEVRSWAGWHHHVTLVLLAGLFLLQLRGQWGEKSARADAPPGQPGSARAAAPTELDPRRPAGVAHPDAGAQRRRRPLARQTTAA